jgi:hypothetical protein
MCRLLKLQILLATVCCALVGPVSAQSINIDIGPPGTEPPTGYRAAGLPGQWQKFEATTWGVFHNLVDVNGNPIAARVRQIGGTEIVIATLGGPADPQGSDAILLGDALLTHALENCLFFENLTSGTYEVLSYAWVPTAPTTLNHVWIDFHPVEPLIGGLWPGRFKVGVSHARHEFVVTNGVINMHSGIPSGNGPNPGAALNGIQLRLMGPEPPLFVDRTKLVWLAALDATRYDVVSGDLATLRSTGGDFFAATDACLIDATFALQLSYTGEPNPGDVQWFLVRGKDTVGDLTWNAPGTAQVGNRDLEINAAVASCP